MLKIAHVTPYPLTPAKSGGALRSGHLMAQLSQHAELRVIAPQTATDFEENWPFAPLGAGTRIFGTVDSPPPESALDVLPSRLRVALKYRLMRRTFSGPAERIVISTYHLLKEILEREQVDAVVLESLEAMSLGPIVRRLSPQTRLILDAHNVDHLLLRQIAEASVGREREEKLRRAQQIELVEKHLDRHVDMVFACSEVDADQLRGNGSIPVHVIPNGVDTHAHSYEPPHEEEGKQLLFCGSLSYMPNREGLSWFLTEAWPAVLKKLPDASLMIMGRGASQADQEFFSSFPNVQFLGEVDDVIPHYRNAAVSIVPLLQGSGTRLKILEAMSLGTAVVSTSIGAEGIEYEPGNDLLIADESQEFADNVIGLVESVDRRGELSARGRELVVRKYDWASIGEEAFHRIRDLLR